MSDTKSVLLEAIVSERRLLDDLLAQLTPEDMLVPGVVGAWSVKDMLAHIYDWEQRFLGWYATQRRGKTPEMPVWADIDALNRRIYEDHRDLPIAKVLAAYRASFDEMVATVRTIPERDLDALRLYPWIEPDHTLLDYVAANSSGHYGEHRADLERWLAARGGA